MQREEAVKTDELSPPITFFSLFEDSAQDRNNEEADLTKLKNEVDQCLSQSQFQSQITKNFKSNFVLISNLLVEILGEFV